MKTTRYNVSGSVRGTISTNHRTLSGAVWSMLRDVRRCASLGGGAYSDACVKRADGEPLSDEEHDEIASIKDSLRR